MPNYLDTINVSGPSSSAGDSSGDNYAPGTGFGNVASGVGSILGALGNAGTGISQIIDSAKANPNNVAARVAGNAFNVQTGTIPWGSILIVGLIAFVMYLIFRN